MNNTRYLNNKRKLVDSFLKKYITSKKKHKDCPPLLSRAMGYALMGGGKRVRPILSMASFEAAGGTSDFIIPIAASLELIHTYSLIHDDLPAMDNDDFRRNKPTTHKVYGEATAILAGDALLTDAFHLISGMQTRAATLISIINELSFACGPEGMVGGQTVDILLEGRKARKKDLVYIHTHKTGALIRASVRIGAIAAHAPENRLRALTEYGEKVGLAFQIMDDILDITGSTEVLGKTAGVDDARGKNTYPSLFGIEKSHRIAEQLINESVHAIKIFKNKAEPLEKIATYILSRRN